MGDLFPGFQTYVSDVANRHLLKLGLLGLLLLALFAIRWVKTRGKGAAVGTGPQRGVQVGLLALTLLSVGAYFEFGWLRYGQYMNPHDVYHYYIGAKYSAEHQYFDLYRASYLAETEIAGAAGRPSRFRDKSIRNLENGKFESVRQVERNKSAVRDRFSPARWAELRHDIDFFASAVHPHSKGKFSKMLRDKGYNATPVWNAVARVITNLAPTGSARAMRAITFLDLALLTLLFAVVRAAFGWRVAALALCFHGLNYMGAFVHIKGAFLRFDWLLGLVASMSLLRIAERAHLKARTADLCAALAGAALAYAGLARVFPFIFAFGPGALVFWALLRAMQSKWSGERVAWRSVVGSPPRCWCWRAC
jgi:hypothetical protein